MRRRELIALIGGALLDGIAVAARAQQAPKTSRVGLLGVGPIPPHFLEGLKKGIGQFYPAEVAIEDRHPRSASEGLPQLAADLVRLNVDVIFARGPQALTAARNATSSISIVAIDLESDPVAIGFVKTLARPGGNITGV